MTAVPLLLFPQLLANGICWNHLYTLNSFLIWSFPLFCWPLSYGRQIKVCRIDGTACSHWKRDQTLGCGLICPWPTKRNLLALLAAWDPKGWAWNTRSSCTTDWMPHLNGSCVAQIWHNSKHQTFQGFPTECSYKGSSQVSFKVVKMRLVKSQGVSVCKVITTLNCQLTYLKVTQVIDINHVKTHYWDNNLIIQYIDSRQANLRSKLDSRRKPKTSEGLIKSPFNQSCIST